MSPFNKYISIIIIIFFFLIIEWGRGNLIFQIVSPEWT